ncbi:hypothetical protein LEM8419_02809 [Neolewinella maritima]|uniref:DEAD/DEAH box helicase n=1 Tax=Neolewinella maritima TaxID=1383882 RepID=A0ABN8FAX0_9BACT|nr:DEAD/DEAH box helicase [Neolewinella maritima]CAH1001896.1 hypothetical protein LEM8419_02809 [Neolewinella maritima]
MQSAIVINFFEFRTGVWLPKAYFVGLDEAGRPRTVHQTARRTALGSYGIPSTAALDRILHLAEELRDKSIAEHFRRGSKKVPTLAGLLKDGSKERESVLRYIHLRSSELLIACRQSACPVTLNLDTRAAIRPALVRFAKEAIRPRLYFTLDAAGMHYRLRLLDADGQEQLVRHLDPRILTNRPAPGWIAVGRRLVQVWGMRGDGLRPFLTRDVLLVPPADVSRYLRKFVTRAVRLHDPVVEGFDFVRVTAPTGLRLAAVPHPFDGHYLIRAYLQYEEQEYDLEEPELIHVSYTTEPPYQVTRTTRDPAAETELMRPVRDRGLGEASDTAALSLRPTPTTYENLRWLLHYRCELEALGIRVDPPEEDGQRYTDYAASIQLSVTETGDWLDLLGTVQLGSHSIPFVNLVRHLQRGDRRYELPDGSLALLPEEWFVRYAPGLELARVANGRVRLARSQAALLRPMGLSTGVTPDVVVPDYAPADSLHAVLRPYQLEGVRWLVRHYHERLGACLADDMGLGKTLQTIAVLLYAKEQQSSEQEVPQDADHPAVQIDLFAAAAADDEAYLQPLRALIVLPASLVYNWATELRRFAPSLTVLANVGTKRHRDPRILRRYDVLLTTYQTALRDQAVLQDLALSYIILDESQQIKNRQSKIFRSINTLPALHRISLSGTPIENSLSDLWSQMQFINPGLLGSYAFFKRAFITPIEVHDDTRKKEQLRQLVNPHLLRRTKAEVAPDLPELDVQVFYCEMTAAQRRRYEAERSAARNALLGTAATEEDGSGGYKLRVIQTLTRLRQLANHPVIADPDYTQGSGKFAEAIAQWDTLRRAGHKVLVFSSMVKHLELFRTHLREANQPFAWLTGSVDSAQRAVEVGRFQEDPAVQTFLISIKAGGTGLNLTAADYVFILDPWWNPSTEDQAIARAHRIGRRGNVFARKFLSKDTLEEKIHRLQQRKKRLAGEIIDGKASLELDPGEIEFLLT